MSGAAVNLILEKVGSATAGRPRAHDACRAAVVSGASVDDAKIEAKAAAGRGGRRGASSGAARPAASSRRRGPAPAAADLRRVCARARGAPRPSYNPAPARRGVDPTARQIASKDKDFRYMATSDLLAELGKDSFRVGGAVM
jgi:hypothetical protein